MERKNDKNVAQLCDNIELFIGRKVRTPKDFEYLAEIIFVRTHLYVSATTLKRMWGYLNETTRTRTSTLDVLSKFIGYKDWTDFCNSYTKFNPDIQEGSLKKEYLAYTDINEGQILEIEWMPSSKCTLEYIGNKRFKVLSSSNTHLQVGDDVSCCFLIEGKPLYFIDSEIDGIHHDMYYVGKMGGISFKIVK